MHVTACQRGSSPPAGWFNAGGTADSKISVPGYDCIPGLFAVADKPAGPSEYKAAMSSQLMLGGLDTWNF